MEDKRKFTRAPFSVEATLGLDGGAAEIPAKLLNVSLKGALVEVNEPLQAPKGTGLTLVIRLPESEVLIEMRTQVAYNQGGRIGLQCLSIDLESMTHLRRLLELNLGDPALVGREMLRPG